MKKIFFDSFCGENAYLYVIGNEFLSVGICNFGASIHFIKVDGVDIALGFRSIQDYIDSGTYAGATVGRVCNRIKNGTFALNGKKYFLFCNENGNHLHGGKDGFDKKLFEVLSYSQYSVVMRYVSADMEEGYPGKLELVVTYSIDEKNLKITFDAVSDQDTLWNPTNHVYFNLDGESTGNCYSNTLMINSEACTEIDNELTPTGKVLRVKNTCLDFTVPKQIGRDASVSSPKTVDGYDHNYILNEEFAARAESKKTGIAMEVFTDLPCIQFYSGGSIRNCRGKTINYGKYAGFCLEPQFCPNAINMDGQKEPVMRANVPQSHYIVYKFTK